MQVVEPPVEWKQGAQADDLERARTLGTILSKQ